MYVCMYVPIYLPYLPSVLLAFLYLISDKDVNPLVPSPPLPSTAHFLSWPIDCLYTFHCIYEQLAWWGFRGPYISEWHHHHQRMMELLELLQTSLSNYDRFLLRSVQWRGESWESSSEECQNIQHTSSHTIANPRSVQLLYEISTWRSRVWRKAWFSLHCCNFAETSYVQSALVYR
jgi:hypothetical protein